MEVQVGQHVDIKEFNRFVLQWIYGIGNNTQPTINYPIAMTTAFTIVPRYIRNKQGTAGSSDIFCSSFNGTSCTLFSGGYNVSKQNIETGTIYTIIIIGEF